MYDVTIIGAGIVGSLIAQKLSKYNTKVLVLEKNSVGGLEQTMSCSAIVHSGIDPEDNTKKAHYNLLGNRMMDALVEELKVEINHCGAYICQTNENEKEVFEELLNKAKRRNIPYEIHEKKEMDKREKNISYQVIRGIWLPTTSVIFPTDLTYSALEIAADNNVEIQMNNTVKDIKYKNEYYTVITNKNSYDTKYIINCAGIYSSQIYKLINKNSDIYLRPKKGAYYILPNYAQTSNAVIYPLPNETGKGILSIPTTHGNMLIGPNSILVDDPEDDSVQESDLKIVRDQVTRVVKDVQFDEAVKLFAGVRAQTNYSDFIIEWGDKQEQFYNLISIDSPGLTSSPAISEHVVNLLVDKLNLSKNKSYKNNVKFRKTLVKFNEKVINKKIKENSDYGKIICRCEKLTKGEIIDEIRRPNGARTVSDIKHRLRPLMGKCQGTFCQREITNIIAQELNMDIKDVLYRNENSQLRIDPHKGANNE